MYESICITPKSPKGLFYDLGLIAECLIFYKKVYLIVKSNSLAGLLNQISYELIFQLIDEGHLQIIFIDEIVGVLQDSISKSIAEFDICFITSEKTRSDNAVRAKFVDYTNKQGKGRRLALQFLKRISSFSYQSEILKSLRLEFQKENYIEEYIKQILQLNGIIANDIIFRFGSIINKGYSLQTNIDFNSMKKLKIEELDNPSTILANYVNPIMDSSIYSTYNSEFIVNSRNSMILNSRINHILQKRENTLKSINNFQDLFLNNSKIIRETINKNEKSFEDILPILKKSLKFKDWLTKQDDNENILKSYYKEVTADTWIDKLPNKITRWSIFTGIGLTVDLLGAGGLGTAIGVGSSVIDNFLLDKLISGWKPNHFFENELKKYLAEH